MAYDYLTMSRVMSSPTAEQLIKGDVKKIVEEYIINFCQKSNELYSQNQ